LEKSVSDFALDAKILLVCRSGRRSNQAVEFLDSEGYLHVYDMADGMLAWEWKTGGCAVSWDTPASVIGEKIRSRSKAVNYLLLVLVPLGAVWLWRKEGRRR
jgi:hypothetical protein